MASKVEIEASKSKRGRTLFAALMKELHRRGGAPVKGDLKNEMRRVVADKMKSEAGGESQGVFPGHVTQWTNSNSGSALSIPSPQRIRGEM